MRACLLVVLVACSSSSFPESLVTCADTVDDYCAQHPCARTLLLARHDTHLRRAFLTRCDDYEVVSQVFANQLEVYFYKEGELAAVELEGTAPGGLSCVAGPPTFYVPPCVRSDERLQSWP